MKNDKLPYSINEYVNKHFKEDFLFEVKDVRKIKDRWIYTIEVSKDNYIHRLRFNESGGILVDDIEEAFPADVHEEPGFESMPE